MLVCKFLEMCGEITVAQSLKASERFPAVPTKMGNKWGVVSWILSFQTTFQPNQQKKRSNGVRTFFSDPSSIWSTLINPIVPLCAIFNQPIYEICAITFSTADYLLASSFVYLFKSIVLSTTSTQLMKPLSEVSFFSLSFSNQVQKHTKLSSYCLLIILPIALFQVSIFTILLLNVDWGGI